MSSLFADTHNVVAILEKSDGAEGFEQIIDFLSGSYIHYALTVNPYIYISCIKQFWNTASVKRSCDVTRLQALVDKKKIVISEVVIRKILQLDDAEGVVCLPNEEIFAGLAQMGYEKPSTKLTFYKAFFSSQWKFLIHTILQSLSAKRTSWNEFSTAMASAVICLSKDQKFNFSKYIFDSLVCNVNSSSKFYTYPRFIQLIIQNQVRDLSTHTTRFISPALTQKVFANMRRVRKGFSGVETPLFEGMLTVRQPAEEEVAEVQVQVDTAVAAAIEQNVAEDVAHDAIPSPPPHDISISFSRTIFTSSTTTKFPSSSTTGCKISNSNSTSSKFQKQTALGKDTSNSLIVDSLLKTIWFSIHHHLTIEVLAIPGQTATGVNTPRSDEDRLKLMELIVFLLQKDVWVEIRITDARLSSYRYDAEGVVCLPNEEIFAGLAQMGYEKPTSWNEFSTAMASAVICLSKGQKFNFSKYIFDSLIRNVDSSSKFYMYPRFIQLIIQNQVGDLSTHTTHFISLALTQKVFANMRRVGKGFSGVETPLFDGMLAVRQPTEEGVAEAQVQVDDVVAATVEENVDEDVAHDADVEFPTQLQQVLNVCSALTKRVENLENANAAQKLVIIKLKARVKRLEKANMVKSSKLRRLRKVGASKQVEFSDAMEDVFNQGSMIDDMDKDEEIELVKDADIAKSEGRHTTKQAGKQAEIYHIDLDHSSKVLSMQEDDSEVQEVVEVVTTAKLITKVVTAAASQVSAASITIHAASATIPAAKPTIPATAPTAVAAYIRRRNGVIIRDPEEELSSKTPAETPKVKDKGKGIMVESPKPIKKKDQIELDAEYARQLHEEINRDHDDFNKDIDWDAAIDHVNQKSDNPQYIKRYQGMKKRPQTESEARKNMMIYLENTAGYKMDFFKGMTYAQICPIFQARFDENMRILFKSREEIEEEDQEIIKSLNETLTQKAAKRRKLSEEAQEAEDLRKRLEVVDDEDDDVFIEATLLARKVPVVDYHIVLVDNKPKFKIMKADETHQFHISFTTLLKNIDREDLENL
uniref:Synaptobrevin, longin-like domain protein n=1 Tax=Tanacetum cinerariifolium TaxID=118510 RepID=A0A6L2KU64_TANCI|nr:hypothetical protein [Tanacetum cinerariifolium]